MPAQAAASVQVQRTSIYDQLLIEQEGLNRVRSVVVIKGGCDLPHSLLL